MLSAACLAARRKLDLCYISDCMPDYRYQLQQEKIFLFETSVTVGSQDINEEMEIVSQ